jgi:HAD superfamily hydrolase (TIGR01509 family)
VSENRKVTGSTPVGATSKPPGQPGVFSFSGLALTRSFSRAAHRTPTTSARAWSAERHDRSVLHGPLSGVRAAVFDVGETLVDESRAWSEQARRVGVTPFSLMAVIGAMIEAGRDHREAWDVLGVAPPEATTAVGTADLYPDAIDCLRTARDQGLLVGIAGNQPTGVEAQLAAAGFEVDFIASSAGWGVAKPSPEFFARVTAATGVRPDQILYVGDRLDNDVLPARAVGMRTAFIRRGPWGFLHAQRPEIELADVRLESLNELSNAFNFSPHDR